MAGNPLNFLFGWDPISAALTGVTFLEGSTPQGAKPSAKLREGRARYAGSTGMYGRYAPGGSSFQFRGPGTTPPEPALPGPVSPAAERAYRSEASRVAQMTAQNPDLQRYEDARLKAVAPGATPEQVQSAEDIGMQVWAKANPKLAAKVKPGQAGYDAIQGTLAGNMARGGQGFTIPGQLSPTPQGFPTQVPGLPTGAGYASGFGMQQNLAPGAQLPPPPAASATPPAGQNLTSTFGGPSVVDAEQFQKLLGLIGK